MKRVMKFRLLFAAGACFLLACVLFVLFSGNNEIFVPNVDVVEPTPLPSESVAPKSRQDIENISEKMESQPERRLAVVGEGEKNISEGISRDEDTAVKRNGVKLDGRVIDSRGLPRKGVIISLPLGRDQTDKNGEFSFDDIRSMVGEGQDRGKFTILVPRKSWYMKQMIETLDVNESQHIALGDIVVPQSNPKTVVRGQLDGDESLFPRMLRMTSEDGSIEALVAVRRDGTFQGNDYPAGTYTLSNASAAGTPTPKTAQLQSYKLSLLDGKATELIFVVSEAAVFSE